MHFWTTRLQFEYSFVSISGLVVEYIVAIDVTRVRFPADASFIFICFPAFVCRASLAKVSLRYQNKRPRGLMDKASVFGTEDCRFESYRGQTFCAGKYCRSGLLLNMYGPSSWSYGVTVSTLDFESSDGGSNPPGTLFSE